MHVAKKNRSLLEWIGLGSKAQVLVALKMSAWILVAPAKTTMKANHSKEMNLLKLTLETTHLCQFSTSCNNYPRDWDVLPAAFRVVPYHYVNKTLSAGATCWRKWSGLGWGVHVLVALNTVIEMCVHTPTSANIYSCKAGSPKETTCITLVSFTDHIGVGPWWPGMRPELVLSTPLINSQCRVK